VASFKINFVYVAPLGAYFLQTMSKRSAKSNHFPVKRKRKRSVHWNWIFNGKWSHGLPDFKTVVAPSLVC